MNKNNEVKNDSKRLHKYKYVCLMETQMETNFRRRSRR